jgi:hypothetical protein
MSPAVQPDQGVGRVGFAADRLGDPAFGPYAVRDEAVASGVRRALLLVQPRFSNDRFRGPALGREDKRRAPSKPVDDLLRPKTVPLGRSRRP